MENGVDWALGDTGPAIDAVVRMNVNHGSILIKAIHWANLQASLVFTAFAGFCHDHRHNRDPPVRIVANKVVPMEVRIWTTKRTVNFKIT